MSNTITSQSFLETSQKDTNKFLENHYNELDAKHKKQFDAVSKCFDILKEAGVEGYLYAKLFNSGYNKNVVYQYNNLADSIKYEADGSLTRESAINIYTINAGVMSRIMADSVTYFRAMRQTDKVKPEEDKPTFEDDLESFTKMFKEFVTNYQFYITDKTFSI